MAHSLSAKKRIRQNLKRRGKNRWRRDHLKQAVKAFEDALAAGDKTGAAQKLNDAFRKLDKVAAKGTIHRNTADRKKSRLARKLAQPAKA